MKTKNQVRAKLLKDPPTIGEGVPMASASQKPISINDILYSGLAHVEGYSPNRELEYEVTTWRVIQINYKERYYRIRGVDGCELSINHENGCPHLKLYHYFSGLQNNLLSLLDREKKKTERMVLIPNPHHIQFPQIP